MYQAVPYVGFGQVSTFIKESNKIFAAHKIALPLESQRATTRQNRQERGLNIQRQTLAQRLTKPTHKPHKMRSIQGDFYPRIALGIITQEMA